MYRFLNSERGETQISIILGALVIGVLSWGLFALQGCIKDHKDGKVQRNEEIARSKIKPKIHRERASYKIAY